MTQKIQKFYCFVDETGQDTMGKLFLVAIILKENTELEELDRKLQEIEVKTNKRQSKWKKTKKEIKVKFLSELLQTSQLKGSIFYSEYSDTKEYSALTSLTIAKSVLAKNADNYSVVIVIDGLNDKERDNVRVELKRLKIKYNKIRGMKDEQNIFLRLSDAMAGFLREAGEQEEYTLELIKKFEDGKFISRV